MALRRSIYKTPAQLRGMVEPGRITAAMLEAVRPLIRPGVTTLDLDAAAFAVVRERRAKSNFQMVRGYHHTTCISVNEQVVHGIPGERVLQPGDIVSVDCGAQFRGWNGDSAITVVVPDPERPELVAQREELSRVTEGSMWAGIAAMASVSSIDEIGAAIELAACLVCVASAASTSGVAVGLFLLGLGWSAVTVPAAALLTGAVDVAERPYVQGFGDFSMNAVAAIGAAISGPVMAGTNFSVLAAIAALAVLPIGWAARQR